MGSQSQRWVRTAAVLGLTFLPLARHPSGGGETSRSPAFAIAPPTFDRDTNAHPQFSSSFIDPGFLTPSVHVASLCEISGGRLLATWYGGTREGARDINIYTAALGRGETNWSAPWVVVTRDTAQRELSRYVKKVGNALLFSDGGDRVSWNRATSGIISWIPSCFSSPSWPSSER